MRPPGGAQGFLFARTRRHDGVRRKRRSVLPSLTLLLVLLPIAAGACGEQPELDLRVTDAGVVRTFEVASREHVEGRVNYEHTPPVGGDHSSAWQRCGFYSHFIIPERGVHSMEHGAVWIAYHPRLARHEVDRLRELAGAEDHVLVSRWNESLPAPVVASAWGRQVRLQTSRDAELQEFIREFAGGPQSPERGVPC